MPDRRILVVDDEEGIRELLRHHLERERYRVVQRSCEGKGQ
jgi:DNA-binding response OmpR family regulator